MHIRYITDFIVEAIAKTTTKTNFDFLINWLTGKKYIKNTLTT